MGERLRAWRSAGTGVPLPSEGFAFIAGVAVLFFYVGRVLQGAMGERGLLASEWLLLALPAIAFALAGPYDARRTLALRAPSGRGLAAAALIALGGIPVGWAIGWLQLQLFPAAGRALGGLEQLVTATDAQRALWLLFLVALTPAVCEELVFRGVLLQSLSREMRAWRAVLVSAAIFGAFHLSFETAIRFLPTAWIGVLLGLVVWHTRSLYASMLMHFVNNGLVVLLLWQPALREVMIAGDRPTWMVLVAGPLLLAAGLWLLPRRSPLPDDPASPDPTPDASRAAER